jgi:hypothetical protein
VQDLAKFFKIAELDSEADFPTEIARFEEVSENLSLSSLSLSSLSRSKFQLRLTILLSLHIMTSGSKKRSRFECSSQPPLSRHG